MQSEAEHTVILLRTARFAYGARPFFGKKSALFLKRETVKNEKIFLYLFFENTAAILFDY